MYIPSMKSWLAALVTGYLTLKLFNPSAVSAYSGGQKYNAFVLIVILERGVIKSKTWAPGIVSFESYWEW